MPSSDCLELLNRLLRVTARSLPAYLAEARPWGSCHQVALCELVENLAQDQAQYALRVGQMIYALGGYPNPGGFPMEFTDIHDLSVDYLLGRLIESQHAAIAAVEACVAGLARQPAALALGQEILGNLRGHLENFQAAARSLAARPASVAPRPSPLASSS